MNAELNLRFRLQSIFFRLSIFNEVISFSIKHISVRQSNFPLVYIFCCVCCFFFSFPFSLSQSFRYPIWFSVAHRWIQIKLFICMIVVILLIRKGFSLLYSDSLSFSTQIPYSLTCFEISWKTKIWLKLWLFVIGAFLITRMHHWIRFANYNESRVVSFTTNFTRNILLFCNPIKRFNHKLYTWYFIIILSRSLVFLLLLGSNVFNLLVEWNRYMCWNNFSYHKKDIQFINPGLTNFVWNIYTQHLDYFSTESKETLN